jgi:hypothetical protein
MQPIYNVRYGSELDSGTGFSLHSCDRASWQILTIKPTRCTNFSNLFWKWKSTCFGQFLCPSSGVFYCTHSNGCMSYSRISMFQPDPARKLSTNMYDIYHCCVYSENSWWWTEELSEKCRVSIQNKFQKLVHHDDFIIRIMHTCSYNWIPVQSDVYRLYMGRCVKYNTNEDYLCLNKIQV